MRLFLAIELGDAVKAALVATQSRLIHTCKGVRWIPREQLHLTLKFLGEVPDPSVASICTAMAEAAAGIEPLLMTIDGYGCFPLRGGVRIVWAGIRDNDGSWVKMAENFESAMEPLGFPRENKPFSPHVTLGRVREDRSAGRIRAAVGAGQSNTLEQTVNSVTLMSSVLSPKGPTYTVVSRASLGSAADSS